MADTETYPPQTQGPPQGPAQGDVDQNQQIDKHVQGLLRELGKKVSLREQWSRTREIWDCAEQRYFYKGEQHGFRNRDAGIYQVGQAGGGYNAYGDGSRQPTFRKVFNIYLGYAKSFMAVFCQSDAPTRFEPEDPKDSADIEAAREANKMKRVVDKFNPPKMLQQKIAKFLFTDPRVVAYTRFVVDGEQFGFDTDPTTGERTPRGREIVTMYGGLETKVPLAAGEETPDGIRAWDYLKISTDHPVSEIKYIYGDDSLYPGVADNITGGIGVSGTDQMARMARISTKQGARQISEDSIAHLCTRDRYWFRPSLFWEFTEDDRNQLQELFPTGVMAVFVGNTFCEAREETMDDHIAVMHGIQDEGEGRISLGAGEVPLQKEFNDAMNACSEAMKYAIPATWYDPDAIDTDAFEEQVSEYGAHYPLKKDARQPDRPIADMFFTEPPVEFPAAGLQYMDNIQGPLSQFITGQQPALFGGEMSDQKTARGYAMARDQALGLMSLVWNPFKIFRSKYMQQAVTIAAKERVKRGQDALSTYVPVPGKRDEQEEITVALSDMGGSAVAYPETDENFPESWTQKKNQFMQIVQFAGTDPIVAQVASDPNNLGQAKDLLGLTEFTVPGADDREKQLQEIADMYKSPPVPDIDAVDQEIMQAQASGQQLPPLDPSNLPEQSSVPIGEFDNDQIELAVCVNWINGHEGQTAKRSKNPQDTSWYQNVVLHAKAHQARIQQQAAQQAMMAMAAATSQAPEKQPPGKNNQGSPEKPLPTPPEGNLPQTSGPAENPSPLM